VRTPRTSGLRKFFLALSGGLCLSLFASCGSDEGQGTPPRISNLFLGPGEAPAGRRPGLVGVSVSLEYADPDGDIAFVRMSSLPCGQGSLEYMDMAPGGITGNQAGVVWLSTRLRTNCPAGTYTYEFSVFDQKGHQSNVLPASFTLTP
jgi:hypothetical protein